MAQKIGFLGIGHLATYVIKGLRYGGCDNAIYLSPRGADNARALANSHDCTVLESNQQVVDMCDIIFISVAPRHYDDLANSITVPSGKVVASVVAGVALDTLRDTLGTDGKLYRTFPLSCSELGQGFVPVYPADNNDLNTILGYLGNVYKMNAESDFNASAMGACLQGSFYYLYDTMIQWFVAQGYDENLAKTVVLDNIMGSANFAKLTTDKSVQDIGAEIALSGTYTETGLNGVRNGGGLQGWLDGLNAVKKRLDDAQK